MKRAVQMLVVLGVLALLVAMGGCGGESSGPGDGVVDTAVKPPPPPPPPPPEPTDCRIAYTQKVAINKKTTAYHIFTVNTNGTDVRQITSGTGTYIDAAWHPDGQSLCCTYDWDLHRIFLDGSAPVRLTTVDRGLGYAAEWGAWSPDGSRIAFTMGPRTYVLDVASGVQTQITEPLTSTVQYCPKWSPDGATIIFGGYQTTPSASYRLYSVSSDAAGAPYAPTLVLENAKYPDWSAADGSGNSTIAYTGAADGALYTVSVDAAGQVAGSPQMLVAGPDGTMPSWAPDGSEIVYNNKSAGKLYIVDVATSQVRELTAATWYPPDWSPAVFGGS